jgi:formylmethanofuran dehydrogenase subunit C
MSDCIGPINIIPDNNQVVLLDNNKSITVIDNNCCTNVNVTQPITSVIQVLTGPIGATGTNGINGSSGPFSYVSGTTWNTTSSIEITGSFTVSGSNTFRNIGPAQFTGSVGILGTSDFILQVHGANDYPWAFGIYNDTYNPTQSVLAGWINNTGEANIGTEVNKPLQIYTNANYGAPTVTISSSGVTIDNTLTVINGITGSLYGTASYAKNAATASNILGGKATHIPFFNTDTTLATSSIYQSGSTSIIINQDNNTTANPEALYVWQPSDTSINVISGKGNLNNYLQLNIQNTNQGTVASSDVVATANNGNELINYIDMGINSQNFSGDIGDSNDAYLYSTGNDLHIGNASNFPIQFFAGGANTNLYRKFQLSPNGYHEMTGSLDISGSLIVRGSITSSLQGTASYANNAKSSSYALTASYASNVPVTASYALNAANASNAVSASYALNADNANTATYASSAGNGGVTQIIAGSGVTLLPASGLGAVTVITTGGGGTTVISGSNVTQSFSNSNTWTFAHNLGTRTPIIEVFDSNYNQIIPQNIQLVNSSSATITFPTLESGFAIASLGGTTGTVISSSYSLFSTYATTASYYAETDPIFTAKSASFATTGSNTFKGNQIVTGSLFTTGSNTLVGNTVLSGSVNISGSTTIRGTINFSDSSTTITGSLNITGSTTQTGNNTLIGTTTLTGSILINGNITPQISASFDLGSVTNPWRTIYLQSGSISIRSDIPGNPDAIISNTNGNVSITAAGFQIKSGSTTPFTIDTTGRTIIKVPTIPANDQGAFSIVGSSDGTYQPVTNDGGLLHLTSNDGVSSRITSDAFGTTAVSVLAGRKARGTAASPLPVQAGDTLTRISAVGWTGPEYGFTMSASVILAVTAIETVALENFTTSSFGTKFTFYNAPSGSTIRTLSATIDTTGITIPSSSRFFGTASWANNAQTASYVTSSNIVGTVLSSSYALTASYVQNAQTASYITTAQTASYVLQAVSSSFASTASYVQNAQTASYVLNAVSASYASTASYAPSYVLISQTGSFATTGSNTFTGNQIVSGSITTSGSLTVNGPAVFNDLTVTITGSLLVTGSTTHRGDITITTGSIFMDGTAQTLILKTAILNPSAYAIYAFPTASYHGASYNFTAIEDSTGKSTTYNVLVASGNNKVTNIQTYLIKSEGSAPTPTIATAINAGNIELRVTDTGTFTYRGIVQLF